MKIDHIGIATERLEQASALWQDALGLELDSTEEIASQGVRVAMLALGESHMNSWNRSATIHRWASFSGSVAPAFIILRLGWTTFVPR